MLLRCESLDPSMSQTGQKQTSGEPNRMSALSPKADIRVTRRHVCFGPCADIKSITALPEATPRRAAKSP